MTIIESIDVMDVEKRRYPSKHYAYVIEVLWSDGKISKIGRRYSDFFDFQMVLLEKFPVEGGQYDPTKRIIPFLLGKSLFQRTNTRAFALKRMESISEYCVGIAKMPRYILENGVVKDFFRPNPEDRVNHGLSISLDYSRQMNQVSEISGPLILDKYVAVADYKKEEKRELDLKSGEVVDIVQKRENGWWLAANEEGVNGWVPATYLDPLYEEASTENNRLKRGEGEFYEAIYDYSSTSIEEISFKAGEQLEVLEKNLEGWWFAVKKGNLEGWVPASYLHKPYLSFSDIASEYHKEDKFEWESISMTKKPPPKRSTVRVTLTKAAVIKIKVDFEEKMLDHEKRVRESHHEDLDIEGVYETIANFDATYPDCLSFQQYETFHAIQKSNTGWWFGRIRSKRGWVPEAYIRMISPVPTIEAPKLPTSPMPTRRNIKTLEYQRKNVVKKKVAADRLSPKSLEEASSNFSEIAKIAIVVPPKEPQKLLSPAKPLAPPIPTAPKPKTPEPVRRKKFSNDDMTNEQIIKSLEVKSSQPPVPSPNKKNINTRIPVYPSEILLPSHYPTSENLTTTETNNNNPKTERGSYLNWSEEPSEIKTSSPRESVEVSYTVSKIAEMFGGTASFSQLKKN